MEPRYTGIVIIGNTYIAPDGHRVIPTGFSMMGIVATTTTNDGRQTTVTISRRSFASYRNIGVR